MCGICGIVDFLSTPDVRTVESMTDALAHRGPDAGATVSWENCALGHRRLSILDLRETANQPMYSHDGSLAIVFNGEIYNFLEIRSRLENTGVRFRTTSDTEVLLELFAQKGPAALDDLNGMFAFAVWDARRRSLFFARDRVGKKPFYYACSRGRFGFSSEILSLMRDRTVSRSVSEQAISEYLLYDFTPAPHSILEHVHKLPAGHAGIFDSDGLRTWRYYTAPLPRVEADYEAEKAHLSELLADAVQKRLISDVPLGAFLSGGLDSTLITALMTRIGDTRVKTFSISFPGTTYDESRWARLAAETFGSDHTADPVDLAGPDFPEVFTRVVRAFGEPYGDSSAIPTWHLCRNTRRKVTVALSGDGGDELFAGYERYLAAQLRALYELIPAVVRKHVLEPVVDALPSSAEYYGTSLIMKLKLFCAAAARVREDPLAIVPRSFSRAETRRLTDASYNAQQDPVIEAARQFVGLDPVSHSMRADMETYLAEDILTKTDRMSMAHALEVRCPFLDVRVVESACRMPVGFKLRRGSTKRILRDVAAGIVPEAVLKRPKQGFQIPLGSALKAGLREWSHDLLSSHADSLFHTKEALRLWEAHMDGKADNSRKLWLLLALSEWGNVVKEETAPRM